MKKSWIIIGVLVIIGIFLFNLFVGTQRTSVDLEAEVTKTWADVQGAYQRRSDLIGNLVATVKGAADFEKSTLTAVTEARANANKVTLDPKNLTPEAVKNFQQQQGQLKSAYSTLINVVAEQYPQLRATENFLELQTELSRTENRINVERSNFNEAVKQFNRYILKFPRNLVAGMYGLKEKASFVADPGAEKAPKIDFSK